MKVEIGRPPTFLDEFGNEIFLPVHDRFIKSTAKRRLLCFHRRARKTSVSLEEVFRYLVSNPNTIGMTLAPIRKQAKSAIWDDPDMLFHPNVCPKEIIYEINKQELTIRLKNGSIYYLDGADTPGDHRGKNPKVLHLTEAGDHKKEIWSQIFQPILEANGGILIAEGTPRPGWWQDFFQSAEHWKDFETFYLSAADSPIFTEEQLEKIREQIPEAVFECEYLCKWIDQSGQVFRNVDRLCCGKVEAPKYTRRYQMGLDLAKHQDWTVITVVDLHTWRQVYMERFNKIDWLLQKSRIESVCRRYNTAQIVMDSTGLGDPIFDDLQAIGLPVRGVQFTTASKMRLVHNLSKKLDQDQIVLLDDDLLKKELKNFTYKRNGNDSYSYSAPNDEHDDIVCSTMLAFDSLFDKYPLVDDHVDTNIIRRENWDILSKINQESSRDLPFV